MRVRRLPTHSTRSFFHFIFLVHHSTIIHTQIMYWNVHIWSSLFFTVCAFVRHEFAEDQHRSHRHDPLAASQHKPTTVVTMTLSVARTAAARAISRKAPIQQQKRGIVDYLTNYPDKVSRSCHEHQFSRCSDWPFANNGTRISQRKFRSLFIFFFLPCRLQK